MSAPLSITQRAAAGVTVVELDGRLVYDEGDRIFRDAIVDAVAGGTRRLLVDLRGVSYMDSGGVGALVAMYLHVMRRGGQLKLLCPSDRACRVLRITHLINVFDVFDSEEQGIRSFSTPIDPAVLRDRQGIAG